MGKCLHKFLLLAAAVAFLASCKDDMYDNSPKEPLELSQTSILVGQAATTVHIGVTARDQGWTMTGSEPWCTVDPASGEKGITRVTVTFTANESVNDEGESNAADRTATLTFTSGSDTKTIDIEQRAVELDLPTANADSGVNKDIRERYLNVWYYNGETRTTNADYDQDYDKFFKNYLSYLTGNTLDGNIWSSTSARYLYSYIEKGTAGVTQPPLNYGMEFDLGDHDGKLVARILYVLEGSPAEKAGLRRGDWFYKVNEAQMSDRIETSTGWVQYNRIIDTLVHPVQGESPKLGMLTYRSSSGALVDERRSVTVSPDRFRASPILHSQTIPGTDANGNATRTAYLVYNSFDPDLKYKDELTAKFAGFKAWAGDEGVTHFVLDLRYNKSGTVEMAELMGNLLVPAAARGKVFARYVFAEGEAAARNREARFDPDGTNGVGAPVIFILTSRNTAGAAELLINALAGIEPDIRLVVIGDVTEGMNVGMVKRTYSLNENEYNMWITAFRCYNDLNHGDYEYGFTPNGGEVNEWTGTNTRWSTTWGWKGSVGRIEDPLLERAMDFIVGNVPMPAGSVSYTGSRRRPGYPREFPVPTNMTMEITEINESE